MRALRNLLQPNASLLGYALFLAINAASVWGGVFPFLPIEFQTPLILTGFSLSQSLVYTASYFASTLGVYFLPQPTRRFTVILPATPYFIGWCFLIAAIYISDMALMFVIIGGALLGLGSAGFYMLWQRLFASQDSDEGNRNLIIGTIISALFYFALYLIPQAITAFLIPLVFLPLFGLAIVLSSREINLKQPMFEDVPHQHPTVYRRALLNYFPSALSIGALGFCCGIVRALAINTPEIGSLVNLASMLGCLTAGLALLLVWQNKSVRINVLIIYRVFFPILISAFLIMPLASTLFSSVWAALLYAVYSVAIMLMMIQCAQASRNDGINPVFIYGFFGGIVYLLHDLGFFTGTFAGLLGFFGDNYVLPACLLAIYLLSMMYFIGNGGFRATLQPGRTNIGNIEFISLNTRDIESAKTQAPSTYAHGDVSRTSNDRDCKPETSPDKGTTANPISPANTSTSLARATSTTQATQVVHNALDLADIQPGHAHHKPAATMTETGEKALPEQSGSETAGPRVLVAPHSEPQYRDRLSKQCALVQQNFRLSNREAEVMELLVRGNTVAHIAEELVVSENTIRTHSKRIYAKLAIHKRQELIDLVTIFNPADL